mmetsp:Transcript_34902/g.93329  ORF Transcript_34902/g.93329 Transcript_34902/m.93329 type:complete len:110 (+) Transcript_34902:175-504(+)
MAASLVGKNVWNSVAKVYQAGVVQRLNQYGLKYDDILNESDPDVKIALSRMPGDLQVARDRRSRKSRCLPTSRRPLLRSSRTWSPLSTRCVRSVSSASSSMARGNSERP